MSFGRPSNHRAKKRDTEMAFVPKGCMVVMVGQEGEEQKRFLVPVEHVNHPLFAELLSEAEKEYGFSQQGAIVIPCEVEHFVQVQDAIDGEVHGHDHQLLHFAASCLGIHVDDHTDVVREVCSN